MRIVDAKNKAQIDFHKYYCNEIILLSSKVAINVTILEYF